MGRRKSYLKVILLFVVLILFTFITGCASLDRAVKDVRSDAGGGLNRELNIYSNEGKLIKQYKGKFDIADTQYGNKVKFDINGKRVIIYNATVLVEEK